MKRHHKFMLWIAILVVAASMAGVMPDLLGGAIIVLMVFWLFFREKDLRARGK